MTMAFLVSVAKYEPRNTYESLFPLGSSGHAAAYPSLADRPSTRDLQDWHVSSS